MEFEHKDEGSTAKSTRKSCGDILGCVWKQVGGPNYSG